jgi:hypothetical protein
MTGRNWRPWAKFSHPKGGSGKSLRNVEILSLLSVKTDRIPKKQSGRGPFQGTSPYCIRQFWLISRKKFSYYKIFLCWVSNKVPHKCQAFNLHTTTSGQMSRSIRLHSASDRWKRIQCSWWLSDLAWVSSTGHSMNTETGHTKTPCSMELKNDNRGVPGVTSGLLPLGFKAKLQMFGSLKLNWYTPASSLWWWCYYTGCKHTYYKEIHRNFSNR